MSAVETFYAHTASMVDLLESGEIDRDEKISAVEMLLEKREGLMAAMVPPYTEKEQILGQQLISLDQKLTKLLSSELAGIQRDLKGLNEKKESNMKYVNPYQNMSIDGMFYDQRK
ncbi:flagellar protein FliT [Mesobacillus zeae]|uniref:Flagellar protein FliT n=1 Tax=Mesobacillus zeae TaxID=1917180 RepID=A0A398B601_9BACI|nr:flagellar protein FliT [Mesobacillus zeae]RID84874.1 flagellar protein FliT [Mesobacillus zeae]